MDDALIPDLQVPGPTPTLEQKQDLQKERILASLTEHPGWPDFAAGYKARIMELRTLSGVDMSDKSDAQVGQLTRAYQLAAQMMEQEYLRVEQIAAVVKELPVEE